MRIIFIALVMQMLAIQCLYAGPVTLKCTTDSGDKAADLVVDVEKRTMTWAHLKYDIFHVNDTYISAYEKSNRVGGEVWVINRNTGLYKRGAVGIYCSTDCSPSDKQVFLSRTYEGRCVKQQF